MFENIIKLIEEDDITSIPDRPKVGSTLQPNVKYPLNTAFEWINCAWDNRSIFRYRIDVNKNELRNILTGNRYAKQNEGLNMTITSRYAVFSEDCNIFTRKHQFIVYEYTK